MSSVRPIFVFSLPRSGSTLLQRMLAAHSQIATTSEPWVLLPLLSPIEAARSSSDVAMLVQARDDFCAVLPAGRKDYQEAVRMFAMHLYTKASSPSSRYFLDKTPRYHLIARDIVETFPDGRFIFLWRNPLAIAASMMRSWSAGRWNLYRFEDDLVAGLKRLIALSRERASESMALKYEDLVLDAEQGIARLLEFLQLPFERNVLERFAEVELKGRFGDATGTRAYRSLSTEPLEKWPLEFVNPLRKRWARRYLDRIGPADLAALGYSRDAILEELAAVPLSWRHVMSDTGRMIIGRYWRHIAPVESALRGEH